MTPGARAGAAIEVLDAILGGSRAEAALTRWGRGARYAGSGDRRAVRDLVYDALRRRRSAAWAGGSADGRGLVLGLARLEEAAGGPGVARLFDGSRHAPAPPAADEQGRALSGAPEAVRLDCPDWLLPLLRAALGAELEPVLQAQQQRAPLFLRAALRRGGREAAQAALARDGITARAHPGVATALEVTQGAPRLARSRALAAGLVEPMDAHSQATVLALGDTVALRGQRVLDYCAGAGGKALMLADLGAEVTAHDALPQRMADLAPRARRAGLAVTPAATPALAAMPPWPLVLADAPCSGTGTWRRDPQAKWALTPARLAGLTATQDAILDACAPLVAPGGRLAFVTCSLLAEEGPQRVAAFLARAPGWCALKALRLLPGAGGDGFQIAILARVSD